MRMIIAIIVNIICQLFEKNKVGFITPSVSLCRQDITISKEFIDNPSTKIVEEYESAFAKFVSTEHCISYASGRMAFYSILKVLGIGKGDDVCLTAFTCAVMVNAVLKTGANVIYVDIEKNSLGTSVKDLQKKVTPRTKVIVAQHTFGIPCKISAIKSFAVEKGIFLVEDCALSLGTMVNNKMLGTWGDAAIFSTDHTKPINTLIGGCVCTNSLKLASELRSIQVSSNDLSKEHQYSILQNLLIEHKLESFGHKWYILYSQYWIPIKKKILRGKFISPYLLDDSTTSINNINYPYPAKLPSFLAYIGLTSLESYIKSIPEKRKFQNELISLLENKEHLPNALFDKNNDIVLLRLPYLLISKKREDYSFLDSWIWFKKPIIATNEPLKKFGYLEGMCQNSEYSNRVIMNIPCLTLNKIQKKIVKEIQNIYK